MNMMTLNHVYDQWISRLIKMNANYAKEYNDKDRISYQQHAREVRMEAEKYSNCVVIKSSWEDWNGKKK
jgi:L,D-peptidoglycan transpeptidase YkuD (ErfK/YbiS/YcfS/YnhG family)